jgi:hypothetical protein
MWTRLAPVLLLLPLLAACGEPVAVESTVDRPYDGPMYVKPDFSDRATVPERSGAAGRALECEGEPYDGGGGDYVDSGLGTVQDDAREALENFQEEAGYGHLPRDGFVVERVEGDRVLFSYDVGEQTKIAYIAADGVRDHVEDDVGWGIESWASCDPAELPAGVTETLGLRVWHDQEGHRVPVTTITHYPGPEHCDWQDITFLSMGDGRTQYLGGGGTEEFAGQDLLETTYDGDATLPDDATDTGYEYDDWHLWLAADQSAAYVVGVDDPSHAERWPAAKDEIACA